jgi:hypothetical protein
MTRILVPRTFFGRYFTPFEESLLVVSSAIGLLDGTGVLDLDVADNGRGVRDTDAEGEWNAYVMKSASDRITS